MHFFSFFKTLVDKEVTVELKNGIALRGTLHSVDQYLNVKLTGVSTVNQEKYPHLLAVRNCFIRGSVVRYIFLPKQEVDTQLLQDSTRRAFQPENTESEQLNPSGAGAIPTSGDTSANATVAS